MSERSIAGTAVADVRVAVATARNRRRRNEDAIGLSGWVLYGDQADTLDVTLPTRDERPVVVAIADGMGGPPDGHRAARIAVEHLARRRTPPVLTAGQLRTLFNQTHAAVHEQADATSVGMGCTAAVVVVPRSGAVLVGNVGDVRVYRVVDGYASQLTRDDRVDGADSAVTSCLGGLSRRDVDPHLYEIAVLPGDRFIVCSDGLHDVIDPSVIRRVSSLPAGAAASEFVRAAGRAGDNVTVAVIDIPGTGQRPAVAAEPELTAIDRPAVAVPPPAPARRRGWFRR